MDPTIAQALTGINDKLDALDGKVDKMYDRLGAVGTAVAEERIRVTELARRVDRAEAKEAEFAAKIEAAQRRLDEAEGARRAAQATGIAGIVSGLSGFGAALWAWATGGGHLP